jgi:mRNA-degrading endonuclease YafQ of YafQ-DinJ toxin-antitoxin module
MYSIFRTSGFKKGYKKLSSKIDKDILELALVRSGSHSELFKK